MYMSSFFDLKIHNINISLKLDTSHTAHTACGKKTIITMRLLAAKKYPDLEGIRRLKNALSQLLIFFSIISAEVANVFVLLQSTKEV